MLDPELSLTLGQTFSLLFPPDDAKGEPLQQQLAPL